LHCSHLAFEPAKTPLQRTVAGFSLGRPIGRPLSLHTLRAARDSLRNVVSIRDFLLAVQVGSETAVAILDKVESKILAVLEVINEDAP
jgi:hypothetical protein